MNLKVMVLMGVSLNDSDNDEGFDWTDVLPDQLINLALVVTSSGPPAATKTGPPSTTLNTVINKPLASNNVPAASNTVNNTGPNKIVSNSVQTNSVPIVKPQIVGENILMVPKKYRNIGLKRKSDEMEPIGTQQSVNKK